MFEHEPIQVVILQSIGGQAEPKYGLERAFSFQPGDSVSLHPKLAKLWIQAEIARPVAEVSTSELVDLKILGAK